VTVKGGGPACARAGRAMTDREVTVAPAGADAGGRRGGKERRRATQPKRTPPPHPNERATQKNHPPPVKVSADRQRLWGCGIVCERTKEGSGCRFVTAPSASASVATERRSALKRWTACRCTRWRGGPLLFFGRCFCGDGQNAVTRKRPPTAPAVASEASTTRNDEAAWRQYAAATTQANESYRVRVACSTCRWAVRPEPTDCLRSPRGRGHRGNVTDAVRQRCQGAWD